MDVVGSSDLSVLSPTSPLLVTVDGDSFAPSSVAELVTGLARYFRGLNVSVSWLDVGLDQHFSMPVQVTSDGSAHCLVGDQCEVDFDHILSATGLNF